MNAILAIDPGPTESAYVLIDNSLRPVEFDKITNQALHVLMPRLLDGLPTVAIEAVASYGMPVGAEVFETCVWIGRFAERCESLLCWPVELVFRHHIKMHHCHNAAAKDSNIVQALVDRFAKGQPNRGKGKVNSPGWFHGFAGDVWQAYALAVYVADTQAGAR